MDVIDINTTARFDAYFDEILQPSLCDWFDQIVKQQIKESIKISMNDEIEVSIDHIQHMQARDSNHHDIIIQSLSARTPKAGSGYSLQKLTR